MALFTEGLVATIDDLRRYDSSVLDVASSEGIDLGAKLEIAQRELGIEITSFLIRNSIPLGTQQQLNRVVVTEPLLHAHCVHALELVYRDAFNSQLNDRFKGRWKEYSELSHHAQMLLFEVGVGMSSSTIPKAEAPTCSSVGGGQNPDTTYYVASAWANKSGSRGPLSDVVPISIPANTLLAVFSTVDATQADGWHLYIGSSESSLTRQSEILLDSDVTWVLNDGILRQDLASISEQTAATFIRDRRRIWRG